jgi:hypothetical protein
MFDQLDIIKIIMFIIPNLYYYYFINYISIVYLRDARRGPVCCCSGGAVQCARLHGFSYRRSPTYVAVSEHACCGPEGQANMVDKAANTSCRARRQGSKYTQILYHETGSNHARDRSNVYVRQIAGLVVVLVDS